MKQIATAFIKAKKSFGPALKSANNPHFKTRYADLAACLEAVDDALLENGIALYQETFEDATGVTVETVLLHESGEAIRSGKLHVPAAKQDPQGYGSALTYARRYSLMAACGIAAEDDDGNAASRPPTPKPAAKPAAITEVALKAMCGTIAAAPTLATLKDSFTHAYKLADAAGDAHAKAMLTDAKDARKLEIEEVQSELKQMAGDAGLTH